MISFGGEKEDTSVTCLERQCLKSMDVTLDGEQEAEDVEVVDWVNSARWEGAGLAMEGGTCYSGVVLDVEGEEKHCLKPGHFLLIKPDREEDRSVAHYPCRVLYLAMRLGEQTAHVQWLARGKDTVLGNTGDPREFFLTRECEDILLTDISKVLELQHRPVEDIGAWKQLGGTEAAITSSQVSCGD